MLKPDFKSKGYGYHLTIDGSNCSSPELLDDLSYVSDVIDKVPEQVGLRKLIPPYVFRYVEPNNEAEAGPGITGFLVLAESHVSVHTYPTKNFVFIDVFSCNAFDTEKIRRYLKEKFKIGKMDYKVIIRGQSFPRGLDIKMPVSMKSKK